MGLGNREAEDSETPSETNWGVAAVPVAVGVDLEVPEMTAVETEAAESANAVAQDLSPAAMDRRGAVLKVGRSDLFWLGYRGRTKLLESPAIFPLHPHEVCGGVPATERDGRDGIPLRVSDMLNTLRRETQIPEFQVRHNKFRGRPCRSDTTCHHSRSALKRSLYPRVSRRREQFRSSGHAAL